jgi:hypothetical protein
MYSKTTLIVAVVLTFLVSMGICFLFGMNTSERVGPEQEWATYTSEDGFSFQYPEGVKVSEIADPKDPNEKIVYFTDSGEETPPPLAVVHVRAPSFVSFSLWEGIGWEHFEAVMKSFDFTNDATPGVDPHGEAL